MRFNLIVEYEDGSSETIASDLSWKLTADGPIRSNNEYDGEEYDAPFIFIRIQPAIFCPISKIYFSPIL